MNTAAKLKKFQKERKFVRFSRRFEKGWVSGFVLDVGAKFVLLSTCEEVRFNGFGCFRIADIKGLRVDSYAAFALAALKKLRIRAPKKPRVTVAKLEDLLLSANRAFPLIVIHRETVDPGACWIGKVMDMNGTHVRMREIGPDGKWDKEFSYYKLSEITCVEFDGDYENALYLVGGEPK